MAERPWGKSRLRRTAEQRGYTVSNQQLDSYVETGLIPPGEGPKGKEHWYPDVVDRLVAIRQLGETIRPLSRRVIHLYNPGLTFTTEDALWHAIQDTTPIVEQDDERRDATMRRVSDALLPLTIVRGKLPADWQPPPAKTWRGLVHLYGLAIARQHIPRWYQWAHREIADSLADIPFDERVVLVALCDLAMLFTVAVERTVSEQGWPTDEQVPINPALEAMLKASEAPPPVAVDDKTRAQTAPHPALHTRADWAFSEAVVQPAPSDTPAKPETARATKTSRKRAAG